MQSIEPLLSTGLRVLALALDLVVVASSWLWS